MHQRAPDKDGIGHHLNIRVVCVAYRLDVRGSRYNTVLHDVSVRRSRTLPYRYRQQGDRSVAGIDSCSAEVTAGRVADALEPQGLCAPPGRPGLHPEPRACAIFTLL